MLQTLKNAWATKEIRGKILFTLFILLLYRVGTVIPVPFVEANAFAAELSGTILEYMNTLSGGALATATLFALGVSPYINASIIIQLLTIAIPKLEELQKEGEDGRRVIVDERAPMYFVGQDESYSPMLFIVSDEDMFARYEQTILMVKTLEHFGHKENVHLSVQNSKHCKYVYKVNEEGESVFAKIILSFLDKVFVEDK